MKKISYRKRIVSLTVGLFGAVFFALACVCHNKTEDFSNIITIRSAEEEFTWSQIEEIRKNPASADTFTAWTKRKNQIVQAVINERSSHADIILLCGDSKLVLPWGKHLAEDDTEGCIIGTSLAKQLFGGTEVEGQQIFYEGRTLTVRGVVKEPQNIMLCQHAVKDEAVSKMQAGNGGTLQESSTSVSDKQEIRYDKINLMNTDHTKTPTKTAAEFMNRYGLDGQILHYEYKRNLSWVTDLIPGKWSDFSGWKENWKTLQKDEKAVEQCEKSDIENLYLRWIRERNGYFLFCLIMAVLSYKVIRK